MPRYRFLAALLTVSLASAIGQVNHGFVATSPISVFGAPNSVAVADLNHDGIPDIVTADGYTGGGPIAGAVVGVAVLLGQGNGAYQSPVYYATTITPSFVTLADVNGDGNPDIIVAGSDPMVDAGAMAVLLDKGDGTFEPPVYYTIPGQLITAVYPGDFRGKGLIDLAVAAGTPSSGALAIFLNNGTGAYTLGQQTANISPYGVADFNLDGKLDLVVGNFSGYHLKSLNILYGSGNGTFTKSGPAYPITPGLFDLIALTIQDFNEDGYPDLAVVNVNHVTKLTVLLTNPDGSFTLAPDSPGLDGGFAITAGDFNRDGHMDVAVVDGEGEAQIDVLFGKGNGTFSYRTTYGTDGANAFGNGSMVAADLNGDGRLDLVTVNSTGTVSPLYGKPGGTFNAEVSTGPGYKGAGATVAGDFNGDGLPDVAMLNTGLAYKATSTVGLYRGTGNGHFKTPAAHYNTGVSALAFAAGDVNGDGNLDLVVAGDTTRGLPPWSLLPGNGNGTFQKARFLSSQICGYSNPGSFYLVDINNDHKLDIVTDSGASFGNGDGTFQPCAPFFPAGNDNAYGAFVLGDFNNDGFLDIAFFHMGGVSVYLGHGNGTFNPTPSFVEGMPYQTIGSESFISTGHFTKNGALGLAVGATEVTAEGPPGEFNPEGGGAISVLGGNGDGTFLKPVSYPLSQFLLGLAIADFSGHGLDDVAALGFGTSTPVHEPNYPGQHSYLSLFTSVGDGTLNPGINFGAGEIGGIYLGASPQNMAVADFNGDGAPDIAGLDDAGYGDSINGLGLLLNSRGVTVSLTASPNPVGLEKVGGKVAGKLVTLKATVTASFAFGGSVSADADVTFYDGSTRLGSADIFGGVASLTIIAETGVIKPLPFLAVGTHNLTAVYSGNSNHESRGSTLVKLVVYVKHCQGCQP